MAEIQFERTTSAPTVNGTHVVHSLNRIVATLFAWAERARNRRELRVLLTREEPVFKDIGLDRHDVLQEAFKPFWKA